MRPKRVIRTILFFIIVMVPLLSNCASLPEKMGINYCQWYEQHDFSNLPFGVMTKQEMIDWLEAQGISEFYDEKPNRTYETGVSWRTKDAYLTAYFHQNELASVMASHTEFEGNDVIICLSEPDYFSEIPFQGPEGGGWSIILWYPEKGMALEGIVHEQEINDNGIAAYLTYFFKPNNIEEVVRDQILIVPQWAGQPLEEVLPHVKPWPGDFSQIQ